MEKILTHRQALREVRKFAKKHQRFTNKTIRHHFQREGYTHYLAMGSGTPPTYYKVRIEDASFAAVFKKLREKGVIEYTTAKRWDSKIFEGD